MFVIRDPVLGALRRRAIGNGLIGTFDGTGRTAAWDAATGDVVVIVVRDEAGNPTRVGFDRLGFISRVQSPLGHTTLFENNRDGQPTKITGPTGAAVDVGYDANGLAVAVARAGQKPVRFARGTRGEIERVDYPDGTATAFAYGDTGQVVAVTDRRGHRQSFAFDGQRRLTGIDDANGNTTAFAYGRGPSPARKTHADGTSEFYAYAAGQRLTRVSVGKVADDARPIVSFEHDADGRVIGAAYADESLSFAYDAAGRVTEARCGESVVALRYDGRGHLVEETQSGETVRYEYGGTGLLAAIGYPTGERVAFDYDADGRLARATDWAGGHHAVSYAADGTTRQTAANGLVTTTTFAPNGRPAAIRTASPDGHERFAADYAYDGEDRLRQSRDTDVGLRQYRYDAESQLLAVQADRPGRSEAFAYDPAGNRVRANGVPTTANNLSQIVTAGDARCGHDADGNLATLSAPTGTWRYTWNARGLLIAATRADGRTVRFGYDALGRRIWKEVDGTRTRYLWAGPRLIREVALPPAGGAGPAGVQDYLYHPGLPTPLATRIGTAVYCYHTDHVGTPRRLTNATGTVVWSADYAAFGEATVLVNQVRNPLRFAGQQFDDETGLHYNFFRYYSPQLGRYLSRDPVTYLGGMHVYSYCDNDPVNRIDVLGLWPSWKTVAAIGAGIAVGVLIVATCGAAAPVLIAAAAIGGAVAGGLGEALNEDHLCPSCIAKAALYGALGGAVGAATAIVAAPVLAAAGLGAMGTAIGVGMLAGATSYSATTAANPDAHWSWEAFGTSVALGGVLGGVGEAMTGGGAGGDTAPESTTPEATAGGGDEPGAEPNPTTDGPVVKNVRLDQVNSTQADVSPNTADGRSIDDVAGDMRTNGWDNSKAPPDMVQTDDGRYTTLDHRRLVAADRAGLDEVPANVHDPDEPLSASEQQRFSNTSDNALVDDANGRVYYPGDKPTTWGEATRIRSLKQQAIDPTFPADGRPGLPPVRGSGPSGTAP
ncbi:RHS repeat-associated core domain-containing protein [Sphingomonas sp.]|uniref:RHS repeat-associated core domain-containing protein n=1 Tax=Sphingomonas sp. TaxID=28214 RepID=UPI003AFF83C0